MRFYSIDRRGEKLANEVEAAGDPDQLLSDYELAELAGISQQWFRKARMYGYGPKYVELSPRVIRTKRSDYVAWVRGHTRAPDSRPKPLHLRKREAANA